MLDDDKKRLIAITLNYYIILNKIIYKIILIKLHI